MSVRGQNKKTNGTDIARQWIGQEERIAVIGHLVYGPYPTTYGKAAILRFLSNGQPDTGFNGSGMVLMDLDPYGNDYATAVAVDSGNGLLVLISSGGIARFDSGGALDTTFVVSGIAVSQQAGFGFGPDLAIQADQKILCSGGFGENCLAIQRFDANGGGDPSFGIDGWVTTDFGAYYSGGHIAVQSDGKFVVAGSANNRAALARFWQ